MEEHFYAEILDHIALKDETSKPVHLIKNAHFQIFIRHGNANVGMAISNANVQYTLYRKISVIPSARRLEIKPGLAGSR